eukprot:4550310-Prymnesium_polylepis.1
MHAPNLGRAPSRLMTSPVTSTPALTDASRSQSTLTSMTSCSAACRCHARPNTDPVASYGSGCLIQVRNQTT